MNKRTFLKNLALTGIGASPLFKNLDRWVQSIEDLTPEIAAEDEDFWNRIRSGYRLKPDYINLENGY